MRVLVIGGSGHVGRLLLPRLARDHQITNFDRRPPEGDASGIAFRQGDVTDAPGLLAAAENRDALVYLAMGAFGRDMSRAEAAHAAFDVNAKGVWLACDAAVQAGVPRVVLASTLSIYHEELSRPLPTESEPPDSLSLYGVTKGFGEAVLRRFTRRAGLSGIALRLCRPVATGEDAARWAERGTDCALTAEETARAFHAALTVAHEGFSAVFVAGARSRNRVNLAKAKAVLGWEPDGPPSGGPA